MFSILIVEDNPIDAKIIEHVIKRKTYSCQHAKDAFQAIEIIEKFKIDLILLDWQLPKVSGIEILKTIRAKANYEKTPIIIVSGRNEEKDVKKAIGEGATDYIIKPVDALILETKIDRYLDQKNHWQMVPVSDPKMSQGLLNLSIEIKSISEIGFELTSNLEIAQGTSIVVTGPIFLEAGITQAVGKVFGHYEVLGKRIYRCSLVGMKEAELQKLRVVIRKLQLSVGERQTI